MGRPRTTDNWGAYRLFSLKPGRYRICAKPEMSFGPTEETRERPVSTCYPAAVVESSAEPVVLEATDVMGIDIRLQRTRGVQDSPAWRSTPPARRSSARSLIS